MLNAYIKIVRRVLPSPFSIALLLTLVSFMTVIFLQFSQTGTLPVLDAFDWWAEGLWSANLMVFAMQMMLMLVLGHTLALTPLAGRSIALLVNHCSTTARAAFLISLTALLVGLFNWGLGLIFGAILARSVGESFSQSKKNLNYSLIGAAGYSALMIWHGGISGSALIKAAEPGNLQALLQGTMTVSEMSLVPAQISLASTVFSLPNLIISLCILGLVPSALYLVGKLSQSSTVDLPISKPHSTLRSNTLPVGAEHIDHSRVTSRLTGAIILAYCAYVMVWKNPHMLSFFTPNNINLLLLALCLLLHRNVLAFLKAIESAISGASGILIQFPLYFGILGLINGSGLIEVFSQFFISISNEWTYPLFTFLSAGLVNIFVPSGGGQWVIQGPIIIKSAMALGVPLEKSIMALAYGDQITNMLQPFWALPLLGITKLSARDILPYTLVMFVVGFVVYALGLLILF